MSDLKISWDNWFMSMAYLVAMKSKDPSSKIGAVIVGEDKEVLSMGYNGLPRGVNDNVPEREERPLKYSFYEHGERNAIFNAARIGVSTKGCVMFTQGTPCVDCARAIVQAGIKEVIVDFRWDERRTTNENRQKWLESAKLSRQIFEEAGVPVRVYRGPLITQLKGYFSGNVDNLGHEDV